jgi:hypothetical protein
MSKHRIICNVVTTVASVVSKNNIEFIASEQSQLTINDIFFQSHCEYSVLGVLRCADSVFCIAAAVVGEHQRSTSCDHMV